MFYCKKSSNATDVLQMIGTFDITNSTQSCQPILFSYQFSNQKARLVNPMSLNLSGVTSAAESLGPP